jgi:hypothetical protein
MKITIKVKKQRNPLVGLVMFRKAGSHRKSNKAMRKQMNAEVKKALKAL